MKSTLVFQFLTATLIALLLAACGGGGGSAAVSAPAAGKVWGVVLAIDIVANDADDPQIAVGANGNAIAVWEQDNGTGGTGVEVEDIWVSHYDATTGNWSAARTIDTGVGSTGDPQIAIDAAGNAIAVWEQSNNTTVEVNIRTARYTVGIGWAQPETIDSVSGDATDPQIAIDAAGNAIVVWEQDDGTGTFIEDIWVNRYTAGAWGTAERIETGAGDAYDSQIAVDVNGNAIVVWEQDNPSTSVDDVMANTYR